MHVLPVFKLRCFKNITIWCHYDNTLYMPYDDYVVKELLNLLHRSRYLRTYLCFYDMVTLSVTCMIFHLGQPQTHDVTYIDTNRSRYGTIIWLHLTTFDIYFITLSYSKIWLRSVFYRRSLWAHKVTSWFSAAKLRKCSLNR